MFIQQSFYKAYKNKVSKFIFEQVGLYDINFLQTYFINEFQVEVNQELKIDLDVINDILNRINRVLESTELASELYFDELEVVKSSLLEMRDDWNEKEYNYYFDSYTKQKFKIEIVETLSRIVEVEAFDEEEAREEIEDKYRLQKIILTADDFADVEFNNL